MILCSRSDWPHIAGRKLAMTERPKTPRDLARRMKPQRRGSLRALVDYYARRAKWHMEPIERQRLADAAEHYRDLVQLKDEIDRMRPKPLAPSA